MSRSIDSPECHHGHPVLHPEACQQCMMERAVAIVAEPEISDDVVHTERGPSPVAHNLKEMGEFEKEPFQLPLRELPGQPIPAPFTREERLMLETGAPLTETPMAERLVPRFDPLAPLRAELDARAARPGAAPASTQPATNVREHVAALPTEAAARKAVPVFSGVIRYFPDALCAVAELSRIGNDQHNPGQPLHWNRGKSGDELDALTRHLIDAGTVDVDKVRHSTKVAWRALANLQKEIEAARKAAS